MAKHRNEFENRVIASAVEMRESYEKWLIDNKRDLGESLVAYDTALKHCLESARVLIAVRKKPANAK